MVAVLGRETGRVEGGDSPTLLCGDVDERVESEGGTRGATGGGWAVEDGLDGRGGVWVEEGVEGAVVSGRWWVTGRGGVAEEGGNVHASWGHESR